MPSLGPLTTTGEGHIALGSNEVVEHVTARITADLRQNTRYIGTAPPRGVWHVGQAGLGAFPDDSTHTDPPISRAAWFLHSENEDWWVPAWNSVGWRVSSVWWRWLPGLTVELTVFW